MIREATEDHSNDAPVTDLIDTDQLLRAKLPVLTGDLGPVAVDTERASGYRYFQRAYLIQLKTNSSGVLLIDPTAITPEAMAELDQSLADKQWIIHSASQDLPSLRLSGLNPQRLFDTELAARLLGYPKVGLGPLIEQIIGVHLEKDHANSDWSVRPLPDSWLEYATNDVEYLIELAQSLQQELTEAGKLIWAEQEFAHVLATPLTPAKVDPWRSTTNIHLIKTRLGMAVVKHLWTVRDRIAREHDISPHRIVRNQDIVALANRLDKGVPISQLNLTNKAWSHPIARQHLDDFRQALNSAYQTPEDALPPLRGEPPAIPSPSRWHRHKAEADKRWRLIRPAIRELAESHNLPVEMLISPKALQAVLWEPIGTDSDSVDKQLASVGVRPWQRQLLVPVIAELLSQNHDLAAGG